MPQTAIFLVVECKSITNTTSATFIRLTQMGRIMLFRLVARVPLRQAAQFALSLSHNYHHFKM